MKNEEWRRKLLPEGSSFLIEGTVSSLCDDKLTINNEQLTIDPLRQE